MSIVSRDEKLQAIAANLKVLRALLARSAKLSAEACVLLEAGELNGAIGNVLGLEETLNDAKALFGTALLLHRLKVD